MLMVDKPKYAEAGIKKGDIGCVRFPYAILNEWGVYFTVESMDEDIFFEVNMDDMGVVD